MILTPKNWKSFQHYKERTPAWIKLHKGLMTDFEFVRLPVASRALAPMLWLLASEYEGGAIDASIEKIAFRVHMRVDELHEALTPLIDAGFFDASEVLAMPLAERLPREEDIGKRTREEGEKKSRAASPSSEDFENLKKVYPRRQGNYGWKAAEKKFNSLVKTGVDPKAIIAAATKLGETLRSKIGTEFIPMPASWLNSEDFVECAVVAFEPTTTKFYARPESEQLAAWDAHYRATKGRNCQRDQRGGWFVDSEWPPGYTPAEQVPHPHIPIMKSM